jgi:tRNA pseudouridine55 synthase
MPNIRKMVSDSADVDATKSDNAFGIPPPFAKIVRRHIDGVLLLDKPVGLSSTQAMAAAKRLYRAEKAGHTGTLDPFATGLLPICFGEAAKFSRFMLDAEKSYVATLKLGEVSTTGDTEGEIIKRRDVAVTLEQIERVLGQHVGEQLQTPPMYSALKQNGVALYKLARQGIEVPRTPRQITIFSLSLVSFKGDVLIIETKVSKGTYIRVLAENIGEALGCGAHLTALRRTATGGFNLSQSHTLNALAALSEVDRDNSLLAADSLCAALIRISLNAVDARIFANGGWLPMPTMTSLSISPLENSQTEYRVYSEDNRFLGIGELATGHDKFRLIPMRLMALR